MMSSINGKSAITDMLNGDTFSQQKARKALPILVRQAKAKQPIIYSDLAQELEMSNPRNLNYVLGAVGNALLELGKKWNQAIPPIETIALNKHTGLPGEGFERFLSKEQLALFKNGSITEKKAIIQQLHHLIFQYDSWDDILTFFNLSKMTPKKSEEGSDRDNLLKNTLQQDYDKELKMLDETERDTLVKQRIGQNVLRKKLLDIYDGQCAMCKIDDQNLLRTSHIIPWSKDEANRLEPTNAIMLCGLHDLAFEQHLLTINEDYTINLPHSPQGVAEILKNITFSKLRLPRVQKYWPRQEFLIKHRSDGDKITKDKN